MAISRVLTNAPALVIPPLALDRLKQTEFVKARPKLVLPLNFGKSGINSAKSIKTNECITGLIAFCMFTALPAAIAVFPQISSLDTSDMEPEFQNLTDSNGKPITRLYYNKGL